MNRIFRFMRFPRRPQKSLFCAKLRENVLCQEICHACGGDLPQADHSAGWDRMNSTSKKIVKGILAAAALSVLGSAGPAAAKAVSASGTADDGFNIEKAGGLKILKRRAMPGVLRMNSDGTGTLLADHYSHASHMSHASHASHASHYSSW